MKKIFCVIIAVVLVFALSLTSFAYHPVVEIKSSDWVISSPDSFKVVYPENKNNYVLSSSDALKHSYLNGETYYGSLHWNDEGYHRVSQHEFSPPVCNGEWGSSGESYGSDANRIIFEVGNTVYMAVFHGVNFVYVTDEEYPPYRDLIFDVSGCIAEVDFYKISYPFSSWQFVTYFDVYGSEDVISVSDLNLSSDVFIWYSDADIYNYNHDEIIHPASKINYTSCFIYFEYSEPVSVLEGSLNVTDSYNLFFPGNLSFVEFESYEDDMEHEEVMNAIDEAAGIISGSISDATSDLSAEIVDAAEGINDSIDLQTEIISDKLDDVSDSIDNASQNITDKLGDVGDSINDKLDETKKSLLDGIKGFFIPSDESMEDIDKQWDELLKTRFGALYEVSDIISDFGSNLTWEYIQTAGEKNTITMPKVTVNFGDTPFSFGGYEVSIIPDGFDVLVTAVKGITSIVCTFLFINSLRNKYEKLIGGTAA